MRWLLGVRNEYFENMECFKLNILALITKQVHHHLQVGLVGNIPSHHIEVGTVQKNLPKKLEGLTLCDVVGR